MPFRSRIRFAAVIIVQLALTVAAVAAVVNYSRNVSRRSPVSIEAVREGLPPAVAQRIEQLRRAIPGNGGEAEGGPGGYEQQHYEALAYPDEDVPLDRLMGARDAFASIRAKGVGSGKNRPGAWFLMGPTSAAYQSAPYLRDYVPSQYESSGRVTAMAIAPTCRPGDCRVWVAAAGGGIWRTDNILAGSPQWTFVSGALGINAIGSIVVDPTDSTGNTIWVGTGEANASSDSAAGVGLYKSTDGGDTWSAAMGVGSFAGRAIGSIAINPNDGNVIYAATTSAVRGVASTGGGTGTPGAPARGLYKSTDGGATFTFIHNGAPAASTCNLSALPGNSPCSLRGVRRVALDPYDASIVYAGSYGRGVWRSNDAGATWTQIKTSLNSADSAMRPEIAVAALPDGKTRMYVGEGSSGSPSSRLYRSDDVATGSPIFTNLTATTSALPGYGSYNYCTGQCWYDNLVYTPPGHPDMVYLGGSYQYGSRTANGRALVLSTDAGVSFTDMTKDVTGNRNPNGLHPDQHALVVNPGNPFQFFDGSDGGVMRSSGTFEDASSDCGWRGLSVTSLARCQQMLSRVPSKLDAINRGLATLQFYSVSVDPTNANRVQGGTQDNGTFQTDASPTYWKQTMWGDGGQSGFDVALNGFRFHTFYYPSPDVNFENGAIHDWNWIADRIYGTEPNLFYVPIMSDPVQSRWMWLGMGHAWRTKTHGMGSMSLQEFRSHCNEFTGDFTIYCGDWEPLGAQGYNPPTLSSDSMIAPNQATRLTYGPCGNTGSPPVPACPPPYQYGTDRANGAVSRVARANDGSTLWASTSPGRVFISKNADAEPASAVTFIRLDALATNSPGRFVSGIFVDPSNPNHAFISYSGFNASTSTPPGHVFDVVFDAGAGTATWTSLDGTGIGDLPVNDVVYDSVTGDLYAATDFGVLRRAFGTTTWVLAADAMPNVEVSSLTIAAGARKLYAATHGLGAWSLALR